MDPDFEVSPYRLHVSCLVCGKRIPLNPSEEQRKRSGFLLEPRICDQCKRAILYVREMLEDLEDE